MMICMKLFRFFLASIFLCLSIGFVLSAPLSAQAAASTSSQPAVGSSATLYNPLGDVNSIQALIGKIISAVLGIVGSLALLMFVYGGIVWMTAGGAEKRVEEGKGIIRNSVIGLVIIFLSYTLVNVLIDSFGAVATPNPVVNTKNTTK